jgi:hypothetical protein
MCANILYMIKGFIWPSNVYSEHVEEGRQVEEVKDVEEAVEAVEPVKRYNLRERKPVDYQES